MNTDPSLLENRIWLQPLKSPDPDTTLNNKRIRLDKITSAIISFGKY